MLGEGVARVDVVLASAAALRATRRAPGQSYGRRAASTCCSPISSCRDSLDGRQLAIQARELRPKLNVLFTSGFTESTLAASISADFAGRILSKPYRQVDLAKRLRDVFQRSEQTTRG
jgi:hypothetical protein